MQGMWLSKSWNNNEIFLLHKTAQCLGCLKPSFYSLKTHIRRDTVDTAASVFTRRKWRVSTPAFRFFVLGWLGCARTCICFFSQKKTILFPVPSRSAFIKKTSAFYPLFSAFYLILKQTHFSTRKNKNE